MWWRDERHLVVEVHRQLTRAVDLTGSEHLELLADAVGCEALFVQGRVEESISQARSVQQCARTVGNLMARWLVCGPPVVAAMIAAEPADGIPWVHRCMQDHLHIGTGAGGMFIETRANFAAMEVTTCGRPFRGRVEALERPSTQEARALADQAVAAVLEGISPPGIAARTAV
jgi:hypothetical protein